MSIKIDWHFSNVNLSLSTFSQSMIEMHPNKSWSTSLSTLEKSLLLNDKFQRDHFWHDLSMSSTWRLIVAMIFYIFTHDISASNCFREICWGFGMLTHKNLGCGVELHKLIVWDALLRWFYSIDPGWRVLGSLKKANSCGPVSEYLSKEVQHNFKKLLL